MRRRSIRTEKQTGNQTFALYSARFVAASNVESSKWNKIPIAGNVAVTAEKTTGALVKISNDNDVRLVIARASFQPRFPFTHVVGTAEIRVAVGATNLQPTELVDQEEVDHASHGIRSVHSRGTVLQ